MIHPIPAKIRMLSLIERAQQVDARLHAGDLARPRDLLMRQRVPNR